MLEERLKGAASLPCCVDKEMEGEGSSAGRKRKGLARGGALQARLSHLSQARGGSIACS